MASRLASREPDRAACPAAPQRPEHVARAQHWASQALRAVCGAPLPRRLIARQLAAHGIAAVVTDGGEGRHWRHTWPACPACASALRALRMAEAAPLADA